MSLVQLIAGQKQSRTRNGVAIIEVHSSAFHLITQPRQRLPDQLRTGKTTSLHRKRNNYKV